MRAAPARRLLTLLVAVASGCGGAGSPPDASASAPAGKDAGIECGGLVEGRTCTEADWAGYQCFNGDCRGGCANSCWCSAGTWKCAFGCRDNAPPQPGWTLECGTSPRCLPMCRAVPPDASVPEPPDASAPEPADAGRECGGLVEGSACVEADWAGYQCFNGDCRGDCADSCWCTGGLWKCGHACRDNAPPPDGGTLECGTTPKCWHTCGQPP